MIKLLSVLYSEMEYNKLTVNNFRQNCFLLMMMHRCNNSSKFPRPLATTWLPMGLQQMGLISSFQVQEVLQQLQQLQQQEEALYPMASPKSTPRSPCPGRFARMIQQLHWRASKMWTSCMHCKRKRRLHHQPQKTLQQTLQHPKTSLQGHTWVRRSGTSNRCNPSGTIELWPFHYCSVLCSSADFISVPVYSGRAVLSGEFYRDYPSICFLHCSASLASLTREVGPQVVKGDPAGKGTASKSVIAPRLDMSDSALKFTHVLYNLSPAGNWHCFPPFLLLSLGSGTPLRLNRL